MSLIKRYPNRKLYDTVRKTYITLAGIARLIRDGNEIRVIDYITGEDLTAQTLAQIVLADQKKQRGLLARLPLAELIREQDRLETDGLESILQRSQPVTQEDFARLALQIEELAEKINRMTPQPGR